MRKRNTVCQESTQVVKIDLPRLFFSVLLLLAASILHVCPTSGQESAQEPYISLSLLNQSLGEVLNKIAQDTGYTFELKDEWKSYPVNASIQNLPLSQALKRILTSLNHAIIYESEKKIHILVYGKADARERDSHPVQSPPSSDPAYLQESAASPVPLPEDTEDVRFTDESMQEAEEMEEKAEVIPADQELSIPADNSEEPIEKGSSPPNASSENTQNQN